VDEDQQRLRKALAPDEHLLWQGKPDPRVLFAPADAFLIPFSLVFVALTIYLITQVATSTGGPVFYVFFVVFAVVGLFYLFGRFFVKVARKSGSLYALTDGRAILLVGSGAAQSTPLVRANIKVTRSRDGEHMSVTFGRQPARWGNSGAMYANTGLDFFAGANQPVGFYDVADVAGLEAALAAVPKAG
jgi:hypothetical protein